LAEKKPKKKKSMYKVRRQDAPERSPKRAKTSIGDVSSRGKALVSHDLEFHKGVLLYGVSAEGNEFDVEKEVYQG